MNNSDNIDKTQKIETQIRSQISDRIQSITIAHIMGFIFGAGMAIPPATTSIEVSLWYLLFMMFLLYVAAAGSSVEKSSFFLEFGQGMWVSTGAVYIIAMWYYLSRQISLFPFGIELMP